MVWRCSNPAPSVLHNQRLHCWSFFFGGGDYHSDWKWRLTRTLRGDNQSDFWLSGCKILKKAVCPLTPGRLIHRVTFFAFSFLKTNNDRPSPKEKRKTEICQTKRNGKKPKKKVPLAAGNVCSTKKKKHKVAKVLLINASKHHFFSQEKPNFCPLLLQESTQLLHKSKVKRFWPKENPQKIKKTRLPSSSPRNPPTEKKHFSREKKRLFLAWARKKNARF